MNKNCLNLSTTIEPWESEILVAIDSIATKLTIPFFVVGATARDVVFHRPYNIKIVRATADIDVGVNLESWSHYDALTKALLATQNFKPTKMKHRFIYQGYNAKVDVVPFGAISGPDSQIAWPPSYEEKMNVLGFHEVYQGAQQIKIGSEPDCHVKFPSLVGLSLLKIVAWHDRGQDNSKDAEDLAVILNNYLDAGNRPRFFEEAADLIAAEAFDYELAGARFLGRDLATQFPSLLLKIKTMVEYGCHAQTGYRLVRDMVKNSQTKFADNFDEHFDKHLKLLEHLKRGMAD